ETLPAAVLDEELEPARGAEALHGRRGDHEDARLLDLGQTPLQGRGELVGRRPVTPLLPRLRADEDGARVRAVGARRAREPRERDRELDARRRENDIARSPHDGVGPLERRPVGELVARRWSVPAAAAQSAGACATSAVAPAAPPPAPLAAGGGARAGAARRVWWRSCRTATARGSSGACLLGTASIALSLFPHPS